jgi:hypothetical protein
VTVEQYLFERFGLLKGAWLAAHLAMFIECAHDVGKFPTAVRWASYWGKSERTAWQARRRVRKYLNDEEFHRLVLAAAAGMEDGGNPLAVVLAREDLDLAS